jgi:hypothetical protein
MGSTTARVLSQGDREMRRVLDEGGNNMNDNIQADEARVNVTFSGENGDLPDPVHIDSADGDIKQWVTEAIQNGNIPGIPEAADADFTDFVLDRFKPTEARPYNLISVRPKTPFGGLDTILRLGYV